MNAHTVRPVVLADAFAVEGPLADAASVAVASAIIALCARVQIPLPFTPVPVSGATLGLLLVAAALGARRGAAAAALYLLEGGAGLPVFAGGAAGAAILLGPTGGYLLGFPVAAAVCGALAERGWDRTPARAFAAMLISGAPIFALGLLGLSRFAPARTLLLQGLWPFLPGEIVKCAAAAGLLPLGWRLFGARP